MLIRQTFLYLPAQLLPAAAQFISLVAWSHFASPEVIGIVTLFVSIQDFLVLGFMGFWTNYTVRFASKAEHDPDVADQMRRTSSAVVFGSSALQAIVSIILYLALIDPHPRLVLLPILALVVGGRAFNTFQGERGRGRGDIKLYSFEVITGPVVGMLVGLALLHFFGSDELCIFIGYAAAQTVAAVGGLMRDRSWVSWGRPDMAILRHALNYGVPLIISAVFIWITQNTPRLMVRYFFGLATAGIYALGFGLGFRVAMVAAMSVTAAAFPLAVSYANRGDDEGAMRQLSQNAALLVGVLAASMTGLALISGDLVNLAIAAPLRAAVHPIMLWSLLAGSIICFRQHFLHQVFLLNGTTRWLGIVSAIEAVFAVVIGLICVPHYGAIGGVVSLTVTSVLSMTTMFVLAMRLGLRPPWRDFAAITLATLVMTAAVLIMPAGSTVARLAVRIVVGGAAFALVIALLYRNVMLGALASRRAKLAA